MSGVEARAAPFVVDGRAGERSVAIECLEILRHLPGRRLVARGRLDGRQVAVKLFFGSGARRRFRRERRGLSRIARAGAPVPGNVAEGRFEEGWWIAVDWLSGRPADRSDADAIVALNATLHAAGVVQTDPHPGNFVVGGEAAGEAAGEVAGEAAADRVFAIDGDGVRARRTGRRGGLAALALQLATLDADPATVERSYRRYCDARKWRADEAECVRLHVSTARRQRRRVRRFLAKTLRPCTQFDVRRHGDRAVVYERAAMCPELERVLESPDTVVDAAPRLKDGNTSTVARVAAGERRYVVKRYNAKTRRARRAWVNGHRLCFRMIATARPLAVVLPRGRGPAYLVLEDLGGVPLDEHVARHGLDEATAGAVGRLFEALAREGLTHRDTKATNFVVARGTVSLVDLDALRPARLAREIAGDRRRFLANWEGRVADRFAAALAGRAAADGAA